MKILHLYSNHKWTGPADHALNLVAWLAQQNGLKPYLACGRRRGSENHLHQKALKRNLPLVEGFYLAKHFNWRIGPDAIRLRSQMRKGRFDLIHSHQDNDTLTAILAGCGPGLVTSVYAGEPWKLTGRQRMALSRSARILTASSRVRDYLAGQFPGKAVDHLSTPVDLDRFAPGPKQNRLLAEFNLTPHGPVAGIVARVQRHRRFDLLLQAIRIVASQVPEFKFLIIGRGTHIDELARRPVIDLGLEKSVVFTGYRTDDFPEVLNLLDFKVFLMPGSDGACRAVREALACGKPVVASRRGILPEIIADGGTGRLIDENPESLARAMIDLIHHRPMLQHWAHNAREYALKELNPDKYVARVINCYRSLLHGLDPGSQF